MSVALLPWEIGQANGKIVVRQGKTMELIEKAGSKLHKC